jgi:hypothetical protein
VSLIIVDIVPSRRGNLQNEIAELLRLAPAVVLSSEQPLYSVAYRRALRNEVHEYDLWPTTFDVGATLPTQPLTINPEVCVPVDLEATHSETCRRLRLN